MNDGCEEFLYHYENKIKFDPKKLRNLLITENKKYNNYFLIVPDKVVYTHDIHSKHLTKKEGPLVISRPHVNEVKDLDFVIDFIDDAEELSKNHNAPLYRLCDSHGSDLLLYSMYRAFISRLGKKPYDLSPKDSVAIDKPFAIIEYVKGICDGDLIKQHNNGDRPQNIINDIMMPKITVAHEHLINYQIKNITEKNYMNESNILHITDLDGKLKSYYNKKIFDTDVYHNPLCKTGESIILFHDSNMEFNLSKLLISQHFTYTYFVWDTKINDKYINILKPTFIVIETMERFLNTYCY